MGTQVSGSTRNESSLQVTDLNWHAGRAHRPTIAKMGTVSRGRSWRGERGRVARQGMGFLLLAATAVAAAVVVVVAAAFVAALAAGPRASGQRAAVVPNAEDERNGARLPAHARVFSV